MPEVGPAEPGEPQTVELHDEDEKAVVEGGLLAEVEAALEAGDRGKLAALLGDIGDADMADLLTIMTPDDRPRLIEALGPLFRPTVLSELDWSVKDQLMEVLPNAQVAEAVRELETDDAVYLLQDMEAEDQSEVLAQLPADERATLERSLEYPEDSAGRLMQADFIAIPPFWTVGQTIDYMRETTDLPDRFTSLYVVDPSYHLLGSVPLDRLLRAKRPERIDTLMESDQHSIQAELGQEDIARQFERHNLVSAPVVDEDQRLVGVMTADDVVEIIQEEAEEDIRLLAGVGGDEAVSDPVLTIAWGRVWWLFVNLLTAILASWVISCFNASIEQMVALAVLMPIVASMGGNAGTQTMTVTVRALATRDLGPANLWRFMMREAAVGIVNGLVFAIVLAVVVVVWFGSGTLGLVIAAAMVCNLMMAALSGILIPVALDWFDIDPAVASTVFVTTVTDVVGFLSFLGLATLFLL